MKKYVSVKHIKMFMIYRVNDSKVFAIFNAQIRFDQVNSVQLIFIQLIYSTLQNDTDYVA